MAPLVPPLSSVKERVPVARPLERGAKDRLSEQLPPGAMGDADTQFWVEHREDFGLRLGLAGELLLHLLGAGIEQAPDGKSVARRAGGHWIGARQEARQSLAHTGRLPLCTVARPTICAVFHVKGKPRLAGFR
jgi:hypothetical protein